MAFIPATQQPQSSTQRITDPYAPGYWDQPEFDNEFAAWLSRIPFVGVAAEFARNRPAQRPATPAGEGPFGVGEYIGDAGGYTLGADWMPVDDAYWSTPQGSARRYLDQYASELDPEVYQSYVRAIQRGEMTVEDFRQAVQQDVENFRKERLYREQEAERTRLRDELNPLYDEEIKREEERAGRFRGILENPSSIRGDKEYGQMLANAETAINSQLLQEQSNLSQETTARGLARSGKADELAGRLALGAGEQRAGILTGMLGDVNARGEGSRNRLFGLRTARADLGSQDLNRIYAAGDFLRNNPYLAPSPYQTLLDARLGNLGRSDLRDARFDRYVSLAASLADNAAQRGTDLMGRFLPGGR